MTNFDVSAPAGLTEPVTDGAHRLDEAGVLLAEFRAETSYVDVDRSRTAVVLVSPHPRQQHLAGEHLAGILREELE